MQAIKIIITKCNAESISDYVNLRKRTVNKSGTYGVTYKGQWYIIPESDTEIVKEDCPVCKGAGYKPYFNTNVNAVCSSRCSNCMSTGKVKVFMDVSPVSHVAIEGELKPETAAAINALAEKAYFMDFRKEDFNALCDKLIATHMKPLHNSLSIESVKYFVESGTVSGEFLLALRRMLVGYGEVFGKINERKKNNE